MSSFGTLRDALPWPVMFAQQKSATIINPGAFELQMFTFQHDTSTLPPEISAASYVFTMICTQCILCGFITIALHDPLRQPNLAESTI